MIQVSLGLPVCQISSFCCNFQAGKPFWKDSSFSLTHHAPGHAPIDPIPCRSQTTCWWAYGKKLINSLFHRKYAVSEQPHSNHHSSLSYLTYPDNWQISSFWKISWESSPSRVEHKKPFETNAPPRAWAQTRALSNDAGRCAALHWPLGNGLLIICASKAFGPCK